MLQFREHGPTSRPQEAGERFLRPKMVANLVELQVWNPSLLFFFSFPELANSKRKTCMGENNYKKI